ncbi:hypothetical protein [Nostoc sp.]|uniref:hypothetical protein n=1 Tax=Nostoc sp. TaxID=1180 RepID=UPI002FF8CCF8
MQPTISIPQHWEYPRFAMEQRTKAIQNKLRFLGYSARPILDNYNCCEIARVLQLNSATVWTWVKKGWIRATRHSDRYHQIKSKDFEYGAFSQPASSRDDDGFPAMLDGCLLTHTGLTNWLCAATIPSFSRLTRREVAALTQQQQAEYRQHWAEYQAIRRQHKQQLIALGNAIVPQCAALIFERLKTILSQQQKNS